MKNDRTLQAIPETAAIEGIRSTLEKSRTTCEPTRSDLHLIKTAQEIRQEPADERPVAFLSTSLIQCTLPHRNPGNVAFWRRTNNQHTLIIQPGLNSKGESFGIPWGSLPRLLLIWIVTEAIRTQTRRLELGNSLTEFLRKLELDPYSRGKRSPAKRLRSEIEKLLACKITSYWHMQAGSITGERTEEAQVARSRELWWDAGGQNQTILWGSWIELSADFYAAIMDSNVPCNMRAIRALRRSPLAIDLYMLTNWIGANLTQRGQRSHFLSWHMLASQLGGEYKTLDDLKKNVQDAMRKISQIHPDLRFSYKVRRTKTGILEGGLILYPSAPAIPRKTTLTQIA